MGGSGGVSDQWRDQAHGKRPAAWAFPSGGRANCRWAPVVVSPAGPMTRSELELVQGLGDPLTWPDLLPTKAVEKGQSWKFRQFRGLRPYRVRHAEIDDTGRHARAA